MTTTLIRSVIRRAEPTDRLDHLQSARTASTAGATVVARDLTVELDGAPVLEGANVTVRPGELVAVIGPSGSGKSTLLRAMAGDLTPTRGQITIDGVASSQLNHTGRSMVAVVPQADDLHDDLPLARMLTYAARLRLPRGTGRAETRAAVDRVLATVELTEAATVRVGQLSGGQRRRASVAMELLTEPRLCLLDEPTSGLDPATAETIVAELRAIADGGRTVVFITHSAMDLRRCDRIVAVADGRVVFDGTQAEAIEQAGSADVEAVHRFLTSGAALVAPGSTDLVVPLASPPVTARSERVSPLTKWWALTQRSLEVVGRNRLTLGIMVGSPAMVIAMFAVLFRPGAFDPWAPSPPSAIMIAFWVAFGGFFFGLTYGLLQICPEIPTMQREHRSGVGAGLQILAKFSALTPLLVAINVAMLVVLRRLDRLPAIPAEAFSRLTVTMALGAAAALALGLLASAAVRSPAQASLALPMLCFPAVLFSGAVLPVPVMATLGQWISAAMPDRWVFELIGKDLGLRPLFAGDPSPLGRSLLAEYGNTWDRVHGEVWALLIGFTIVLGVAAWVVLARRMGGTMAGGRLDRLVSRPSNARPGRQALRAL